MWNRCVCRHSMDLVLVLVVALCSVETDIIHAVYLALALLLFRRRDVVRAVGNGMFVWLVVCNFAVNLAKIVYQAPFPLLFKDQWDITADLVSCTSFQSAIIFCAGILMCYGQKRALCLSLAVSFLRSPSQRVHST